MPWAESRLLRSERERLEQLRRALDADREKLDRDLRAERYGAPTIVTEVCCRNCGYLLIKNAGNWWVHVDTAGCSRPVVDLHEVSH